MNISSEHRITAWLLSAIFLLALTVPSVGMFFTKKETISLLEKRRLASWPHLDRKHVDLTAYTKGIEAYVNDHFFLRNLMVAANSLMRVKLLGRSPNFVVLVGTDNWYYLMGDWALHDYLGRLQPDEKQIDTWRQIILERQQKMAAWGGRYLFVLAPNKESVYPEFMANRIGKRAGITRLQALAARCRHDPALSEHFLSLEAPLVRAKAARRVYLQTDTHWTDYGAYMGYRALIEKLHQWYPEIPVLPEEKLEFVSHCGWSGDLALTMGLKGIITEQIEKVHVSTACNIQTAPFSTTLLPEQYWPVQTGCPTGAPRRVVFIADSFGKAMVPFLAQSFTVVLHDAHMEFAGMEKFLAWYKPDLVIHLRVARYLPLAMAQ